METSTIVLLVLIIVVVIVFVLAAPTCSTTIKNVFKKPKKSQNLKAKSSTKKVREHVRKPSPKRVPKKAPRKRVAKKVVRTGTATATPTRVVGNQLIGTHEVPQKIPVLTGHLEELFDIKIDYERVYGLSEAQIDDLARKYKSKYLEKEPRRRTRNRHINVKHHEHANETLRETYAKNFTQSIYKAHEQEDFEAKAYRENMDKFIRQGIKKPRMTTIPHDGILRK